MNNTTEQSDNRKQKNKHNKRTFTVTVDVVGRYDLIVHASDYEQAGEEAVKQMDQGSANIRWCDDDVDVVDIKEQ